MLSLMPMPAKSKLEKHSFTIPIKGSKRPLSIQIFVAGHPDTVFLAGFGNEGRAPIRILRLLEEQGLTDVAVVSPLPYWGMPSSEEGLRSLGITGATAAAQYLSEHFKIATLHTVAESQAAASIVYAAANYPELFNGRIALVHPLGLVHMRKRDFITRMAQGAAQPEQFLDWRTYSVGRHTAWRTLQDLLLHKGGQFNIALRWDIRDQLSKLAVLKPGQVRIFTGESDRLYPAESIRHALEGYGLTSLLEIFPGGHASPAIRAGSQQVKRAIDWCRR
jgi:hypothetical protein